VTILGSAQTVSGTATITAPFANAGTYTVTATFAGLGSITSTAMLVQQVSRAGSTTTLASAPNPSLVGQRVDLTASVAIVAPAVVALTGVVTFTDGATTLGSAPLGMGGTATFSTTSLGVGTHTLTATYGGDANVQGSSGITTQQVNVPTPTSTATSTNTGTATATPTATSTATPTATSTATPTATASRTAAPTGTPTTAPSGASTLTSTGTTAPAMSTATSTSTRAPSATGPPAPTLALTRRFCVAGGVETATEHASLALLNANGAGRPARVILTLYVADGSTATVSRTLPADAQRSFPIAGLTGRHGAFGLCAASDQAVSGQLTLTRPGRDGDSLLGSPTLGTRWYLAEGYTGLTFRESVALLNPGGQAATVRLRLRLPGGRGNRTVPEIVAAHSERVVDVNGLLNGKSTAVSVVADADRPVLVARTLTFSSGRGGYGLTAREGALAAARSWTFAEGSTATPFQTFLTILNPQNRTATVSANVFGLDGHLLGSARRIVAPGAWDTLRVNDVVPGTSSVSSVLTSDQPVVVERPEYFGSPNAAGVAGSDVVGRTGPAARWAAPGSALASGDSEFLLLYNPATRVVTVDLTFYNTARGGTATQTVRVAAHARYTFDVNAYQRGAWGRPGPTLAASHGATVYVRGGGRIVVERSVFGRGHSKRQATQGLAQ